MTSRQHQDWIRRGKPDSGLARPLVIVRDGLRHMGYTVYDYPNDAHLDDEPPQDHTQFSETGYPGSSPKWWRHAIDIMPPPSGSGLPSLQKIGQVLAADRNSGTITWLKYMNWPSANDLSKAVQNYWEGNVGQRSSRDTGHIHLSSITGVESNTTWDHYDIAARIKGGSTPPVVTPANSESEDTMFLAQASTGQLYLCDGKNSYPTDTGTLADKQTLIGEGRIPAIIGVGKNWGDYFPRTGWTERAFGVVVGGPAPAPQLTITDAQLATLSTNVGNQVAAALSGIAGHELTEDQVIQAVKTALQQGVGGSSVVAKLSVQG